MGYSQALVTANHVAVVMLEFTETKIYSQLGRVKS